MHNRFSFLPTFRKFLNSFKRKRTGWLAIDYYENPIGFFEDGSEISGIMTNFTFEEGYTKKPKRVAIPNENLEAFLRRKAERLAIKQAPET